MNFRVREFLVREFWCAVNFSVKIRVNFECVNFAVNFAVNFVVNFAVNFAVNS